MLFMLWEQVLTKSFLFTAAAWLPLVYHAVFKFHEFCSQGGSLFSLATWVPRRSKPKRQTRYK